MTADYSSGTTLTVRNSDGFTTDWYVVVGEPGQEQTETQRITASPTDTTITIGSALKFSHPKSTPVYLCQWNKWAFERKASGGSFTAISTSPLDIEWDNASKETMVAVSGGATSDYYRWRPYNSQLATYGTYSGELPGTGLGRTQVGHLFEQIRKNPVAKNISDDTLFDFCNDFQDLVYVEIPTAWWFTKEDTAVSTVAGDYDYSISSNWSDLSSIKFVLYRYISGDTDITYPLTWSPPAEMLNYKSDANQANDDYAKFWSLYPPDSSSAKGYLVLHPTPKTANCYIQPVTFFELADLDSFDDTIVIPYAKGYVDYCLYRIYGDIKSDESNETKYLKKVNSAIIALKRKAKRQLGQPEFFRFRGHRGWSRLFGEQTRLSSSEARELYW